MAEDFCINRLYAILCVAVALGISSRSWGEQLPLCSLAKTNHQCALPIDRTNPVSPSTVQMYGGESLTVVVENPYGFERYFLDTQSGQMTIKPEDIGVWGATEQQTELGCSLR
jgi:hypothetical protein